MDDHGMTGISKVAPSPAIPHFVEVAEVVPFGGEVPEPLADETKGHAGSDKESMAFEDFKP